MAPQHGPRASPRVQGGEACSSESPPRPRSLRAWPGAFPQMAASPGSPPSLSQWRLRIAGGSSESLSSGYSGNRPDLGVITMWQDPRGLEDCFLPRPVADEGELLLAQRDDPAPDVPGEVTCHAPPPPGRPCACHRSNGDPVTARDAGIPSRPGDGGYTATQRPGSGAGAPPRPAPGGRATVGELLGRGPGRGGRRGAPDR